MACSSLFDIERHLADVFDRDPRLVASLGRAGRAGIAKDIRCTD